MRSWSENDKDEGERIPELKAEGVGKDHVQVGSREDTVGNCGRVGGRKRERETQIEKRRVVTAVEAIEPVVVLAIV